GRFVFTGLSGGKVTLHLEGTGIDAQVEISGLVDGQTLTIAIQVKGGGAQVVHPGEESEVEVEGAIESLTPLKVQGRTITTNANTRIRGEDDATIALSALKVGQMVEVEGMLQADGTILAAKIEVKNEDEGDEHGGEVEFSGTITNKGASSLVVNGRPVTVDANTRILGRDGKPIMFAALQMGQRVEVEGKALA